MRSPVGSVAVLMERAHALAVPGRRRLLGISGAPGAGKSTLAAHVVAELGAVARLVGMDAFHLSNDVLAGLGRTARKGAIDTFDAAGFVALLERLRHPDGHVVYAPEFQREHEESIGASVAIGPEVQLVVTEGNYLLAPATPWGRIRGMLDEAWFCDPPDSLRVARLVARHVAYGKDPVAAREWALGSDQRNADVVAATRAAADVIVRLPDDAFGTPG